MATYFLLNQRDERRERQKSKYIAANDQYLEFMKLTLAHPKLRLGEYSTPVPKSELPPEEIEQRDALFMMEFAYIVFEDVKKSFRDKQWPGWLSYMQIYFSREDYLEWWLRVHGNGDQSKALRPGISQLDRGFEVH
jgi:hypothetical protein